MSEYPKMTIDVSADRLDPCRHIVNFYLSETEMFECTITGEPCEDGDTGDLKILIDSNIEAYDFRRFEGKKTVTIDWREVVDDQG